MKKSTKLIIAAVGLGGLGYFLYKRGLFSKTTTTEVAKEVKKVEDVVKQVVDTGKKTAVEPPEEVIKIQKPLPPQPIYSTDPVYVPPVSNKPITIFPTDELYPVEPKPIYTPSYNNPFLYDNLGFRDNTYFDQPQRIDYTSGKYNQDVYTDYRVKDVVNARFNELLYA
jgi:hypothetical protein